VLSGVHVLEWRAAVHPDAVALTDHLGAELTYAGLAAAMDQSAAQYAAAGIRPGDVAAIIACNQVGWVTAMDELASRRIQLTQLVPTLIQAVTAEVASRAVPPDLSHLVEVVYVVISGGENVFPAEVEAVLVRHPGVVDAAVIGIPDDRWGETVHAVVVAGPGLDEAGLVGWARERLAGFKCPASVSVVPELPRNATGKVLRAALREPFWAGRDRRVS